jgi:2-polyprenyl-3-methyl-5-hydroxy-6-metoxy-1,4-benzoquinol methylase
MNNYTLISPCPISDSEAGFEYFDLGNFPLVNNLHDSREESLNCDTYPLSVKYWKDSTLSSLTHAVNGELLFSNYLFKSEVNIPYIDHCRKMYHHIDALANFEDGDLIVDIGGNDGTLLAAFREESTQDLSYLNIDPSKNLAPLAEAKGIPTLVEFFSEDIYVHPGPKVVVSTNVFQHLKDTNSFVRGVRNMLNDEGFWVLEFPYWIHDLETMQFDQIYHEHMYYYTVASLKAMMEKHGMKIIDAEMQKIHGGSMRLVMVKEEFEYPISDSVYEFLEKEKEFNEDYYKNWGQTVRDHLQKCLDKIREIKDSGKTIAGFGAAAKGCIFLNALGLTYAEIDYIIDDTDIKQGKYIPGTGIQVVSREVLKEKQPDYIIILAHNFADHIVNSLPEYNGIFMVCLPKLVFYI